MCMCAGVSGVGVGVDAGVCIWACTYVHSVCALFCLKMKMYGVGS